jgi:hypothetical protein
VHSGYPCITARFAESFAKRRGRDVGGTMASLCCSVYVPARVPLLFAVWWPLPRIRKPTTRAVAQSAAAHDPTHHCTLWVVISTQIQIRALAAGFDIDRGSFILKLEHVECHTHRKIGGRCPIKRNHCGHRVARRGRRAAGTKRRRPAQSAFPALPTNNVVTPCRMEPLPERPAPPVLRLCPPRNVE